MSFILYCVFRKIFVRFDCSNGVISIRKGLVLKRFSVIPLSNIVKISVKRKLLTRIFRAKEIEISTLRGGVKFYLHRDEYPEFLPKITEFDFKPRLREILFGAFIDTRALGGIFVFIAILRRIGTIFGGEYSAIIVDALFKTAENVDGVLKILHIAVPKIATITAVFALASWIFAYLRKTARLSRFKASYQENLIAVQSGLVTLYEHFLVPNTAIIAESSPMALFANRVPLYLRGVMISPCAVRKRIPNVTAKPPKRAILGCCAAPLGFLAGFGAALILVYHVESLRSAMLLKTALYSGLIVSLYAVSVSVMYMKHFGISRSGRFTVIALRKGLRLRVVLIPERSVITKTRAQSLFQRRSGLCNYKLRTLERKSFKARLIPVTAVTHGDPRRRTRF